MEPISGAWGCVVFLWVKIRPHYGGRASAASLSCKPFGIQHLHFLLCRGWGVGVGGQFWPWLSISDERFRGKRMTCMSKVELVISFGDYLLIISASPLPHCCRQSRFSCSYYLLKELKRKRPRLAPHNWKEATCLRTSKCQLMESASRLEDFIFKQSWEAAF